MSPLARLKSAVVAVHSRVATLGVRRHLDMANAALAGGDTHAALSAFMFADDRHPLGPAALASVVTLLSQQRRYDEASVYAERLLALRPSNKRALRALTRAPRPGVDVAGTWRKIAEAEPAAVEPWLQIARLAQLEHQPEQVLEGADAVLARDPRHAEALSLRLTASAALDRHSDIQRSWLSLHAREPAKARAILMRALDGDEPGAAGALIAAADAAGLRDPMIARARTRLRVGLAVRAYAAEVEGDVPATADAFWKLRQVAPLDLDYEDGLTRAVDALKARIAKAPDDALTALLEKISRPIETAVAQSDAGRALAATRPTSAAPLKSTDPLDAATASLEAGRIDDAAELWRGASTGDRAEEVAVSIRQVAGERLESALEDGDLIEAWTALRAWETVGAEGLAEVRATLLDRTGEMILATPSTDSPRLVALGRPYLDAGRDDRRALLMVARAMMRERLDAEALGLWNRLSEAAPEMSEPWLQIARCAKRMRRPDLGAPAVARLMKLEPNHAEGRTLADQFEKLSPARATAGGDA